MDTAIERLAAELDAVCALAAARVIEQLPVFRDDPTASATLEPFVRLNADEVIEAFRGESTSMTAARNVGHTLASATDLELDAVTGAYRIAKEVFVERLLELAGPDEDLTASIAAFEYEYQRASAAVADAFVRARARR